MKTLVLPGLDGTGMLLNEFRLTAPATQPIKMLALPDDPHAGYAELCEHFSPLICKTGECRLIGESFSGPLAVMLAHRHPELVRHLVLVATFVTTPVPRIAAVVPWKFVFSRRLPALIARRYLVGTNVELIPALRQAVETQSPNTLAKRLHAVSQVDVSSQLCEIGCPITLIHPSADRLVSARHADEISRLNENVCVKEITGPHLILQVAPSLAWQQIMETGPTSAREQIS